MGGQPPARRLGCSAGLLLGSLYTPRHADGQTSQARRQAAGAASYPATQGGCRGLGPTAAGQVGRFHATATTKPRAENWQARRPWMDPPHSQAARGTTRQKHGGGCAGARRGWRGLAGRAGEARSSSNSCVHCWERLGHQAPGCPGPAVLPSTVLAVPRPQVTGRGKPSPFPAPPSLADDES